MTEDEFIKRFVAHMVEKADFAHFDDGTPIRYYAEEMAVTYWLDMGLEMSPEDCADADIADWADDEGEDEAPL